MNRLVIIGNGFDLAHGLKTSYKDFIDWYWEQRISMLFEEESNISEDPLCKFKWMLGQSQKDSWKRIMGLDKVNSNNGLLGLIKSLDELNHEYFIKKSDLLVRITMSIDTKGWVDIENDYYTLLKEHSNHTQYCERLNYEFQFLRIKLVEYLCGLPQAQYIPSVDNALHSIIHPGEVAVSSKHLVMKNLHVEKEFRFDELEVVSNPYQFEPHNTMILDFNYTNTSFIYNKLIIKYT